LARSGLAEGGEGGGGVGYGGVDIFFGKFGAGAYDFAGRGIWGIWLECGRRLGEGGVP